MIKINSELPNCMLEENLTLNEYDFVLFHLYESDERYRNFYKQMRIAHPDRLMIFDNSAYEYFVKGETLDMDKYVQAILDLKPNFYILPDVLRDKDKTIEGIITFVEKYIKNDKYRKQLLTGGISYPMAIAQGSSSEDLVECVQMFKEMGLSVIGLPFHLDFYTDGPYDADIESEFIETYMVETEDIRYAMGRIQWVRDHRGLLGLDEDPRNRPFSYIHMLGSHCPYEKVFYCHDINSMDTGYPVKCAIEGLRLGEESQKPSVIIDDFLNEELPENKKQLIRDNVKLFREYQ